MDRFGKIMTLAVVVMGLMLIIVVICFLRDSLFHRENKPDENITSDTHVPAAAPEDVLPNNLAVGKPAPQTVFLSPDGSSLSLNEIVQTSEQGVWFSYGEQQCGAECESIAALYDMTYVYVGESASESPLSAAVSDPDGACYEAWGLQILPSDVVLDCQGNVLEYHAGEMSIGEVKGMLERARYGRDAVGFAFVSGVMSNGEGGFITNTALKGDSPSGKDVLSESQGLMLMYALAKDDRELFEQTWQFTKNHLLKNGLAAWYVSADGVTASVNALLDDLRIWYALYQAGLVWDGLYSEDAALMQTAIKEYCIDKKSRLVDFTDLKSGARADMISLQYLDLAAIKAMSEVDPDFEPVYEQAENILLDGRISDVFPLYYKNYNYTTRSYDTGNLNTAEALYTLWNLSRAGLLPDDSLVWLKEQVLSGTLRARYRTNGNVVSGYGFHSTAVYALAALIAHEAGDDEMFESALRRMDRKLVLNANDNLFGAYTEEGAVIYSFDQLIPLLVNAELKERTLDER